MSNYLSAKKPFIVMTVMLILILCFSMTSFAAAIHIECEDFEEYGGEQFGGSNIQELESGIVVVGSKPDEIGTECYTSFNVELAEAGTYTFKICYAASESADYARKGDLVLNGKRFNIPIKTTPDWDTFNTSDIVKVELESGPLSIKITSPGDYDNETVKTCNFDWIEYELMKIVEAKEDLPLSDESKNPVTSDFSAVIYILAAVSSAGILAIKKRR